MNLDESHHILNTYYEYIFRAGTRWCNLVVISYGYLSLNIWMTKLYLQSVRQLFMILFIPLFTSFVLARFAFTDLRLYFSRYRI